jgi:hypothetical protein
MGNSSSSANKSASGPSSEEPSSEESYVVQTLIDAFYKGNSLTIVNTLQYQDSALIRAAFAKHHLWHWFAFTSWRFPTAEFEKICDALTQHQQLLQGTSGQLWSDANRDSAVVTKTFNQNSLSFGYLFSIDCDRNISVPRNICLFRGHIFEISATSLLLQMETAIDTSQCCSKWFNNVQLALKTLQQFKVTSLSVESKESDDRKHDEELHEVLPPRYDQAIIANPVKEVAAANASSSSGIRPLTPSAPSNHTLFLVREKNKIL